MNQSFRLERYISALKGYENLFHYFLPQGTEKIGKTLLYVGRVPKKELKTNLLAPERGIQKISTFHLVPKSNRKETPSGCYSPIEAPITVSNQCGAEETSWKDVFILRGLNFDWMARSFRAPR